MATVVPFASCYGSVPPLQLFGKSPRGGNYLSLLTYRGPRCTPRPRLACHAPKMTLRQICRMLKLMKQEAGVSSSGPHVARQMRPELSQTQTQYKARRMTQEPWPTTNYPPSYNFHSDMGDHHPSSGKVQSDYSNLDR